MTTIDQSQRARAFAHLHGASDPLVLPNAWDVSSARAVERAGAAAVATTSAAHAWSLGLEDGDLGLDDVTALLARIVAAVDVPVTADIESGYADDDDGLTATIRAVLATGVAGVNLEDSMTGGLRPSAEQAGRIEAVRRVADAEGVPLFVNARIDTYFTGGTPDGDRLDQTIERAATYVDAGANGVFVPGLLDTTVLAELTRVLEVPVNVMLVPGGPSVVALAAAGVRRISVGPSLVGIASSAVESAAARLLTDGVL